MTNHSTSYWQKKILGLSWPIILANLSVPLVGLVDVAVIGRLSDETYLGGVAVGAASFSAFYWLFGFLRMVPTGLVAQSYGAKDPDRAAVVFFRGSILALMLGALVVLLSTPLYILANYMFDPSQDVSTHAYDYFSIRVFGAPALLLTFVELGVLLGLQKMREVLYLTLILNLINALLDILFVVYFGWEVSGVASGCVISEWAGAFIGGLFVVRAMKNIGWTGQNHNKVKEIREFLAFGRLSGNIIIRTFCVQIPFLGITAISARIDDVVLAGNAVLMQFFYLMAHALDGFAHSSESLSGEAYGAGQAKHLNSIVRNSLILAFVFALLISLIFAMLGEYMIEGLTTIPSVQNAGKEYLGWLVVMPLVSVLAFQFDGIFIGTTHLREMRNNMLISVLVYFGCLAITLDMQNHGLWLSMSVFMAVRGITLSMDYPKIVKKIE